MHAVKKNNRGPSTRGRQGFPGPSPAICGRRIPRVEAPVVLPLSLSLARAELSRKSRRSRSCRAGVGHFSLGSRPPRASFVPADEGRAGQGTHCNLGTSFGRAHAGSCSNQAGCQVSQSTRTKEKQRTRCTRICPGRSPAPPLCSTALCLDTGGCQRVSRDCVQGRSCRVARMTDVRRRDKLSYTGCQVTRPAPGHGSLRRVRCVRAVCCLSPRCYLGSGDDGWVVDTNTAQLSSPASPDHTADLL